MLHKQIAIIINYINFLSCIYLAASSVYYTSFQQIGFAVFVVSYFLEFFLDKKWLNFHFDKVKAYYLGLLLFFLLILIYHPFEHSTKYFFRLVELRFALFVFAIVGIFGINKLYKFSYFANAIVVSALIAMIFLIFKIGIVEFVNNSDRAQLITVLRSKYINSHIVFNSYLNIALVFCWFFLFKGKTNLKNRYKVMLYSFTSLLIIYFLAVSEGRMGIVTCVSLLFCLAIYRLWNVRKLYVLIIALAAPFVVWTVLSNHKKMQNADYQSEARIFIWNAAIEVAKEQPILGYGASRAQEEYDKSLSKFQTPEFKLAWKDTKIMHSHNQFLQTYMEFGVIGLFLLLWLIVSPIFIATKGRRFLSVLLFSILVFQFLTDIVITYQGFPVIYGFISMIILVFKYELPSDQSDESLI